jgi:hypothetical protein
MLRSHSRGAFQLSLAAFLPISPAAALLVPVVLGVPGPLAFLVLPASAGPLVSLVRANLLVPRPLAFLVLPAPEAVGHGSADRHSETYA